MKTILRVLTRRKFTVLSVVAALTLATASAALAGSGIGGVFNLGVSNTVNAITGLTGSVGGPSLQVTNNSTGSGARALDLRVTSGKPPMTVNSATKVTNLNADKLDGKDSTAFLAANGVRADGSHTSSFIDDFTGSGVPISSKTFTAPSAGVVMITGSISAEDDCSLSGLGRLFYNLSLDGTDVYSGFAYELGYPQDCAVGGDIGDSGALTAVVPVSAGSHTVALTASELGSGSFIEGHGVSAVFTPTGSGTPIPAAPSKSGASSENLNHK